MMLKTKTAEAVQEGIITALADENGVIIERNVIQYADAIRILNDGDYDSEPAAALRVAAALLDGQAAGFFKATMEQTMLFYRWLVADVFVRTMAEENGTQIVEQGDGTTAEAAVYIGKHGAMTVYRIAERFSLANHVEATAFEQMGVTEGYELAIKIYSSFITKDFALSQYGREMFELLHDGFIEQLAQDGLPDMAKTH